MTRYYKVQYILVTLGLSICRNDVIILHNCEWYMMVIKMKQAADNSDGEFSFYNVWL